MDFIIKNLEAENVNIEDFAESLNKAKALTDNKQTILDICGDKEHKYGVEYNIVCYADDYANEFSIVRYSHANHMEQYYRIEILSDNGSLANNYTQIGDTNYFYREL